MELQFYPKPDPNRNLYFEIMRAKTPAERLDIACDLTDHCRELFRLGLCRQYPNKTDAEIHLIHLERLEICYSRNS